MICMADRQEAKAELLDGKPSRPSHLYKYQSFSTQTLRNLQRRQIWFSKPEQFNDPFDCTATLARFQFTRHQIQQLYTELRNNYQNPQLFDRRYSNDIGGLEKHIRNSLEKALKGHWASRKDRGIACLSETCENLLMWSHYSSAHRGFCLEFDTRFKPFDKGSPVVYQKHMPVLDTADVLFGGQSDDPIQALFLTKLELWSYEKEWRILHAKGNTAYGYGVDALTGIYFGSEMNESHREIIMLILHGSSTRLYQMKRDDKEFRINANLVDYTPPDYSSRIDARSELAE